jgi:hypothetical protein
MCRSKEKKAISHHKLIIRLIFRILQGLKLVAKFSHDFVLGFVTFYDRKQNSLGKKSAFKEWNLFSDSWLV